MVEELTRILLEHTEKPTEARYRWLGGRCTLPLTSGHSLPKSLLLKRILLKTDH